MDGKRLMGARMPDSAIVTDASSVLGNACATYLAKRGFTVYALMEDPEGFERRADELFKVLPSGSRDQGAFDSVVATVLEAEGKVDLLVICDGLDLVGAFEDSSTTDLAKALETGFQRPLRAMRAVLPAMRKAGSGRIICIVGEEGRSGMPFMGLSSAVQSALGLFTRSLRQEALLFGVQATVLEKPLIWPDSAARRMASSLWSETSPYRGHAYNFLTIREREERSGGEAMETARRVWEIAKRRRMPPYARSGGRLRRFLSYLASVLPLGLVELWMSYSYGTSRTLFKKRREK